MIAHQSIELGNEHLGTEWLWQIGIGSLFVTLNTLLIERASRKHQHWDMARADLGLQAAAAFEAVHHWHHHVADDDIGHGHHGTTQAFLSVASSDDLVLIGKKGAHHLAHVGIVIDDESHWKWFVFGNLFTLLHLAQFGLYLLGRDVDIGRVGYGSRLADREGDGKDSSCAFCQVAGYNGTAMQLDKALDHCKTYARTLIIDRIDLIEVVEDVVDMFDLKASARIGNRHHYVATIAPHIDADRSIFGRELERIAHEVEENTLDLLHIDLGYERLFAKLCVVVAADIQLDMLV